LKKQAKVESYLGCGEKTIYYKSNGEIDHEEKNCLIFKFTDTKFDNQILNHYDILKPSIDRLGFSRTLELSQKLPNEFIYGILNLPDSKLQSDVLLLGLLEI
jgi:hypothetical protein